MVTPTNYLYAVCAVFSEKAQTADGAVIGSDAAKGPLWGGAGAPDGYPDRGWRDRARHEFFLNGYHRETNPRLSAQPGLINFSDVSSCGTVTAVSVPCIFSSLGRKEYSDRKAKSQQGLLDVLSHAGFDVLWRDNNSGCKETCDRVRYEDLSQPAADRQHCNKEECFDERLLERLPEIHPRIETGPRHRIAPERQPRSGVLEALSGGVRQVDAGLQDERFREVRQ